MTRIFGNFLYSQCWHLPESLWHALKDAIQNTIDKRVPSKMTQGRHTHPWINTTISRKINWKQKAHAASYRWEWFASKFVSRMW
jgi:hypothetical protein